MKKILLIMLLLLVSSCGSSAVSSETFDSLERLSFNELQTFIDEGQSGLIYFGWTEKCPDSTLMQKNYLYELVANEEGVRNNMWVVDLDVESPDSLMDKDLREPMTEQFGVKYGPTVLLIEDGEIVDMIEWTPLSADDKTAIPLETIETFFENSGYLE
ncbi:MAG: thioredoxin family protein [Erysipelothrix sp.]|nr:thioredoxin family protein [Erysipelothrix sp.]